MLVRYRLTMSLDITVTHGAHSLSHTRATSKCSNLFTHNIALIVIFMCHHLSARGPGMRELEVNGRELHAEW